MSMSCRRLHGHGFSVLPGHQEVGLGTRKLEINFHTAC